jgi:glutaredoxin
VAAALVALGLAGCRQAEEAPAPASPGPRRLPSVADGGGAYVLRYFSPATGELVAVRTAAEVPEAARGQVIVVPEDPALQGPWLFVVDLTAGSAASRPVRVVDRFALERQWAAATRAAADAASGEPGPGARTTSPTGHAPAGEVILFRTAWCGYCAKAAEYLRLRGIAFVERDLERDPGAREQMLALAAAAGVPESRLGGVPILAIRGRIIPGFDRAAIDAALEPVGE